MDVLGLVEIPGDTQLRRAAAQAGVGRLHGLLHHLAQIAGELQLAGALHHAGLHLQQLAAYLSPGQSIDHADLVLTAPCVVLIVGHAQQLL